jgi:hypothetical protein
MAASSSSSQHRLRVEATKKTKNVIRLMSFGGTFYTHREAEQKGREVEKNVYFKTVARQRKISSLFLPIFPRQENKVRKERKV